MSEDDETIAQHRESLAIIAHSGWHLLRIINDVLDLSAIEANKIELDNKNVNVMERIQDCIETILPLARESGVGLVCNETIECDDLIIHADPFRLKQILLNLIANAVKYNFDGGSVTVHCQMIDVERIRIAVTDTGPGIPEQNISTLFQAFSRVPDQAHAVQGAGVGLSIAKQLTELMGGTIGVESVLGQGSTFWIEIPTALDSP